MKKFLLVTMIGMVLTMSLYGFISELLAKPEMEVDHISETTITVYVE